MKPVCVINGFYNEYEKNAKEILNILKTLDCEPEFIVLTQKDQEVLSFADQTTLIRFASVDTEIILDTLAPKLKKARQIIFNSGLLSTELAGRLAFRLNLPGLSGVRQIKKQNNTVYFSRTAYSGNMEAVFCSESFCVSLCKSVGEADDADFTHAPVNTQIVEETKPDRTLVKFEKKSESPAHEIVFVLGRGVQDKNAIERVKAIAEKIHAGIGASRPLCMEGKLPLSDLVGVSGRSISPKVCLTIGVSGSMALCGGIEKSRKIISINIDEDAPINRACDYSVICDYKEALEELSRLEPMEKP